jgi:transposase
MRKITQHKQRVQKMLEDANVKLASVVSDVFGESGERMLNALSAGQTDPWQLAALHDGRLSPRAKPRRSRSKAKLRYIIQSMLS